MISFKMDFEFKDLLEGGFLTGGVVTFYLGYRLRSL